VKNVGGTRTLARQRAARLIHSAPSSTPASHQRADLLELRRELIAPMSVFLSERIAHAQGADAIAQLARTES
jgi:hypothetical protein